MTILLGMLKWLLIIFVSICVLLILLSLILLFSPINYSIIGNGGIGGKGPINLSVKLRFIFQVFRISYDKKGSNFSFTVKILWHSLLDSDKKKSKSKNKSDKPSEKANIPPSKDTDSIKPAGEDKAKPKKSSRKSAKEKSKDKSKGLAEKIKSLYAEAKKIWDYPGRNDIIKYTLQLVLEEIKAIKPKEFNISGEIGFDDPSKTGFALAAIGIIRAPANLDICINGNFEEKALYLNGKVIGMTSFWSLLFPVIKWALRKPIWGIIKPIIFRKGKDVAG